MGACKHACTLFVMPFNPSPNGHVMTGDDAFYGDGQDDNFSPLTAFLNFMSGSTQQQQLQTNQQEFQEYMYNMYNSPEALKRQFQEAGMNINMLGSTSFGTANGAAAAPAAAPAHGAIEGLAKVAETGANVANLVADTGLKVAQKSTEMTLPQLNKALTSKYKSEYNFNDVQYQFLSQTFDWRVQNEEWNSRTAQQTYYQAVQMVKNREQEWYNLVKEGRVLDTEADFNQWNAETKKQVAEFFVEHGWFPDQNYLDWIYNEYVVNGDSSGFLKFNHAQDMLWESQNRQAARFGAYGNTIKVAGIEVPLEYLIQSGKDLADFVDEIKGTKDNPNHVFPWQRPKPQNERQPSRREAQMSVSDAASILWQFQESEILEHNHNPSKAQLRGQLMRAGYSNEWIAKHWDEVWDTYNYTGE